MAMDMSSSMRAMDVLPSHLVASQAAAKAFVAELAADVRIGMRRLRRHCPPGAGADVQP